MAMKRRALLEAAGTILERLIEGKTDSEIRDELGIEPEDYAEARRFLMERRAEELREKPREHVYMEYVIAQQRNINDLDALITNLDKDSQYNAIVGAIRLRADLHDRIVAKGQEFGMIKKEAEKKELIGGIAIVDLSNEELRKKLAEHNKFVQNLVSEYGETDFMKLPPKPTHYGESVLEVEGLEVEDDDSDELEAVRNKAKKAALAKSSKKKKKAS